MPIINELIYATQVNQISIKSISIQDFYKHYQIVFHQLLFQKIRDLYDIVYLIKNCGFNGKDFIDTIMHYRITYLPKHILQLIEAKKEDPFDIEGIVNPAMDITTYEELKSYLLKELKKYN